jgi:hypothetical protein
MLGIGARDQNGGGINTLLSVKAVRMWEGNKEGNSLQLARIEKVMMFVDAETAKAKR